MTNKEASEWFKKRAQKTTMPGAREAFKLAAEALAKADVPDTNVGEMITKQQMIDVLERVKRTANIILYDGPVLMSYNDVLDSLINIVNFLPAV